MTNQLDDLFKEKLSGHSMTPSEMSWVRVKDSLSKKNKGKVVLRIAAALLLLTALVTTIARISNHTPTLNAPSITKRSDSNDIHPLTEKQPANVDPGKMPQGIKKEIRKVQQAQKEDTPVLNEPVHEPPVTNDAVQSGNLTAAQTDKPIVLEYRLDAVPHPPSAPEVAQEKSGLRRVIELAREAKNGDSPISLRQTKDELFALNFRTKKISK